MRRRPRSGRAVEPTALDISLVRHTGRVPAPASPELQALARELKADAERLVEKIVAAIHEIPEYQMIHDPAVWSEVRQVVRANVPVFYNEVIEGREARDEDIAAARYFARRRVHQGVRLPALLSAYRKGNWILWGELVARVMHRPALQKELLLRAAWTFRHLEIISSAVTEAYFAEQEGRARHRDRSLRDLFEEVLGGASSSLEELKARAQALEVDFDGQFDLFVASAGAAGSAVKSPLLPSVPITVAVAQSAGVAVEQLIAVERGRELVLLAPPHPAREARAAMLRRKLVEALAPLSLGPGRIAVGTSGPVTGVAGVRQAYQEASRAIEIGRILAPADVLHHYESYVLHDVLESGSAAGERLLSSALGPLLALGDTGVRLVRTLEAYFRAGAHLKVAAGLLDIHPNTLAYRMRQIQRLTGLDPAEPEDRLRAEIALRLLALQRRKEAAARTGEPAVTWSPRGGKPALVRSLGNA